MLKTLTFPSSVVIAWQEESGSNGSTSTICSLLSSHNIRKRAVVMDNFREGKCRLLITTDFASRGLDIPQVSGGGGCYQMLGFMH